MTTFNLQLKRKGLIIRDTFVGTKLQFAMYRFKMRKWEIEII